MKKFFLTLFAVVAATVLFAQPPGGGGMPFMPMGGGMGASTIIDVTPVTESQMMVMQGNLGLDDKQAKKIRKIVQTENEKVANVVLAARSNMRGNFGMGGGMPQREQMQRGERPQGEQMQRGERPQGRPDGERRRPNVMAMFDEGNLKELDKIYAQSDKKIEALLTPEQLLKWREQAGMNVAERENRISQILSIITGRGGRENRGGFGGFGGGMGGPMGGPGGPR